MARASFLHRVSYNLKLLPASKIPNSWEDFLKPESKGRKFMVDIRPQGFAALAASMGEESRKAAQGKKLSGNNWSTFHQTDFQCACDSMW